jgi:hypothetical protein
VGYFTLALNLKEAACQNENLSRLKSYHLSKSDFANKFDDFKVYIKTEI